MSGLMTRARDLFRRETPPEPTPYNLRCLCGTVARGMRQREFQIVTCATCGESLLVFPTNPLPVPVAPAAKQKKGAGAKRKGNARDAAPRPPLSARARDAALAVPRAFARRLPPRAWFTPARLAVIGGVLFLVLGVSWQIRAGRLQRLRDDLGPRSARGLDALADGRLDDAYDHLQAAVTALDVLGEPFDDESRVRQAFREVAILHDLAVGPLDEELTGEDAARLATKLRGQAVVIDTTVRPSDETGWEADFVTFKDGEPVSLELRGFLLLNALEVAQERRVVFGARIESVAPVEAGRWVMTLVPDSGVLLTESAIFDQTGLMREPATAAVRAAQRRLAVPEAESPTPVGGGR